MGLNATLLTARQSLDVYSAGVQLAGQNIANASTPGYIREELLLESGPSYRSGSLILGTGVVAVGVQQQINRFLESRIHVANAEVSTATVKDLTFKQLEAEIQELGESDLSTSFSDFFSAIQNLAAQPESAAFRDLVVSQGADLARDIRSLYGRVDDLRLAKTDQIESLSTEANRLIDRISELNQRIVRLESAGLSQSDAGGPRSERYQALQRLSQILPIRYREQENGSVDVFTESDYLILSGTTQQLQVLTTGSQDFRIELSKTGHDISRSGGEIRGLIEARDDILGGFLNQLDTITASLIYDFNRLHASGEGVDGFTSLLSENGVVDPTLPLSQVNNGLMFLPQHGSFEVQIVNQLSGIRETTTIALDLDGVGTDTSLDDLRLALNSVPNLTATLTPRGELLLTSAPSFEFRFASDTSGILSSLGLNSFFRGDSAGTIDVSQILKQNSGFLASGQGAGPADGRNLALFTQFFETPLTGLNGETLIGFYEQTISQLAQNSASESALATGFATFRDSLLSQQQQFTGVSLDEEAIRVLELQRGYQAAARIVTTVNELFAVLLNL